MRMNRLAYPITSLGFGARVGLWVQGCTLHCPECASRDTWDPDQGIDVDCAELANHIVDLVVNNNLDGLTVTGGEPTDQAGSVAQLIEMVRTGITKSRDYTSPFDVLLFSGRTASNVEASFREVWSASDVLVCGPYDASIPSDNRIVASGNQQLVIRTELARQRYATNAFERKNIQFTLKDGDITFAGITGPGELETIVQALAQRGITMGGNSWTNQ